MAKKRLKIADRQALLEWEKERISILNATTVDTTETEVEKLRRIAKLEKNDEAWFKYYFPEYYTCEPAPFQTKATKRLFSKKRIYYVRAWSRELAKTARSMMEVIKLALTGEMKNLLLISNSWDNAARLLMPIMLNLESNQRIINDYGEQKKIGSWETGEFTTLGGVSFRAVGAGQSPRGTRNKAARPDFILIDDIDTDEETRNPERIKTKWKWIEEALVPTMSVSGNYRILFNGNIIAKDGCISRAIKKAKSIKNGFAEIINIRDKNGKSSWPQKNSEEDIDEFLSLISTASAQKEFFNNPLSEGDVFKEMNWGKVPPLHTFKFLIAYGDPAPSNSKNKKGSFKSLWLIGYKDGKFYVIFGYLDHVTNAEFVDWYYGIKEYVGRRTQVYNFIENNTLQDPFYEQVFIPLFIEKGETKGVIGITPDLRKKPDKFARIEGNLEPKNRLGQLILNIKEKDNPHFKRLEEQFLLINPQMKSPADGPDGVEGGVWIAEEKTASLSTDSYSVGHRQRQKSKHY